MKQKTGKRSKTRLQIQQLCDYAKNFKSYFSKVDADDDVGIGVEMCNVVRILVAHAHCYEDSWYLAFKDEAQTALFKDPVRTAQ